MTTKTVQAQIDTLTAELDQQEDRSSKEARKLRKQIRALKDQAGIVRSHPGQSIVKPSAPVKPTEPQPEDMDPRAWLEYLSGEVAKKGKVRDLLEAHRRQQLFGQNLPESPEVVISRARERAGVNRPDTTVGVSLACKKCHAIPDTDRRCRRCEAPLCNCSIKDPDQLCRRCRKGQPRMTDTVRNLGKYGKKALS